MSRTIFGVVVWALGLAVVGGQALAQPQTDLTTPTAWSLLSNVGEAAITDKINEGFRIVDIEVENVNPLRFSAVFVANTGVYAKSWWWYFGQTEAEVNALLTQNNARLIDVEPYQTAAGLRFAVVMIANAGDDFAPSHGWIFGFTGPEIEDWLDDHPTRRIIDIQPYFFNGNLRYAFVWISNTGQHATTWWWYYNVTADFIADRLSDHGARLIDLEETFPDSGTFTCIMVPVDGQAWWWYFLSSFSDLQPLVDQLGARVIDYQRYTVGGNLRFAVVLRRNTNDLTQNINIPMRGMTDGTSGFLLRGLTGGTHAAINPGFVFEPASLMKTVHHVHAMRQVALGNDMLSNQVLLNVQTTPDTGSCPIPLTPPQFPTLENSLRLMMENSSNPLTEAIRQRYGTAAIMNTANVTLGMTDTELNHTLGCLCSEGVNNWLTLNDIFELHSAVRFGFVDPFRDEFYDLMRNSLTGNPANGTGTYQQVLDEELAASSLATEDQTEFRAGVYHASKPGSYSCTSATVVVRHRTEGGYLRVPVRTSCTVRPNEFFFGAFVFEATDGDNAAQAVNFAMREMFRDRIRAAIATWEAEFCAPCSPADLAEPYGTLDIFDVIEFLALFDAQDPAADLAPPFGVWDIFDVIAFLDLFEQGCP